MTLRIIITTLRAFFINIKNDDTNDMKTILRMVERMALMAFRTILRMLLRRIRQRTTLREIKSYVEKDVKQNANSALNMVKNDAMNGIKNYTENSIRNYVEND